MLLALALGLCAGRLAAQPSLIVNRVIQISSAGTPEENCQGLLATLAGIDDASELNSYLLKLEPGRFECGTDRVVMKPFVSIAGSGIDSTAIFGERSLGELDATITTASVGELRDLRIFSYGGDAAAVGLVAVPNSTVRRVEVTANEGLDSDFAVAIVVPPSPYGLAARLIEVEAAAISSVDAVALRLQNDAKADVLRSDLTTNGSGLFTCTALVGSGAELTAVGSRFFLSGSGSISFDAISAPTPATIHVAHSLVGGPVSGSAFTCVGAYDAGFAPLDATCE